MDSSQSNTRSSRLSLRIAPEALDEIREAASAQQQDVTSFVLGAAMERARIIRLETRVLALAPAELARFMAAVVRESGDNSPPPTPSAAIRNSRPSPFRISQRPSPVQFGASKSSVEDERTSRRAPVATSRTKSSARWPGLKMRGIDSLRGAG